MAKKPVKKTKKKAKKTPPKKPKKDTLAKKLGLTSREKSLFAGVKEETHTFHCPIRGKVEQKITVKVFRSPDKIAPIDPKYIVKTDDENLIDDEDFSNVDLHQTLDLDPIEFDLDD